MIDHHQLERKRLHDEFYLNENRYDSPKSSFQFFHKLGQRQGLFAKGKRLCDIGCATGEFLYYMRKMEKELTLEGYDLLPDLIAKAKQQVSEAKFHCGSALDPDLLPKEHADIIFSSGVQSIFDNIEPFYANLIRWTREGGRIFVHSHFNESDVDVYIQYKRSENYQSNVLETGWNIFSMRSLRALLALNPRVKEATFHPFVMDSDLKKREDDHLRSWTFRDENGQRIITNGLSIIQKQYLLEIVVK